MKLNNHTILITGGASGIGFALTERLLAKGNRVIVVGRRADKLKEVQDKHPELITRVADVAKAEDRIALAAWVVRDYPELDMLINNAGVMRFNPDPLQPADLATLQGEIATNLEAPIHLTSLLLPHLVKRDNAMVVTVSSGLAFVPLAAAPVYSATKAAIHSFTLSLRHQMKGTNLRVTEIAPPHVNTDLGAPGANTAGMPLDVFADAVIAGFEDDVEEITYGFSTQTSQATRSEQSEIFANLNAKAA